MSVPNQILLASLMLIAFTGCGDKKADRKDEAARAAVRKERVAEWAFIAKTKEISPSETIKLIRVPDRTGIEALDAYCIVYTNSELKTSNITCPQDYSYEADQTDMGGDERESGFSRYD